MHILHFEFQICAALHFDAYKTLHRPRTLHFMNHIAQPCQCFQSTSNGTFEMRRQSFLVICLPNSEKKRTVCLKSKVHDTLHLPRNQNTPRPPPRPKGCNLLRSCIKAYNRSHLVHLPRKVTTKSANVQGHWKSRGITVFNTFDLVELR